MIRNRSSKDRLKIIRQLDAFPKIKEEYQQSSEIGGTRMQKFINQRSIDKTCFDSNLFFNIFFRFQFRC